MKRISLVVAILFSLACSASALAVEPAVSKAPQEPVLSGAVLEPIVPDAGATVVTEPVATEPVASAPMQGMGMKKGCKRCKEKHGKGKGKGKEQCAKKPGGGRGGAGQHDEHEQHEGQDPMAQRLDMLEARLAKIEAMLEILLRR